MAPDDYTCSITYRGETKTVGVRPRIKDDKRYFAEFETTPLAVVYTETDLSD